MLVAVNVKAANCSTLKHTSDSTSSQQWAALWHKKSEAESSSVVHTPTLTSLQRPIIDSSGPLSGSERRNYSAKKAGCT